MSVYACTGGRTCEHACVRARRLDICTYAQACALAGAAGVSAGVRACVHACAGMCMYDYYIIICGRSVCVRVCVRVCTYVHANVGLYTYVCTGACVYTCAYASARVILGILLTLLREANSRDTFSSLYGYRAFVNPKWLPSNR